MTDVYVAWLGLIVVHKDLIARVAAKYGLTVDRVLQSSLLCVALHDVGKLSVNFQRMMRAKDDAAYKAAVGQNYRHEVAALWLVSKMAESLINRPGGKFPGGGMLETLAVAGHHKFLADEYLIDDQKFMNALTWEGGAVSAVDAAMRLAALMFQDRGWGSLIPKRFSKTASGLLIGQLTRENPRGGNPPYKWLLDCRAEILQRTDARKGHLRDLFMLLKGLLMTADWMASGAKGREEALDANRGVVRVGPGRLEAHVHSRVERRRRDRPELALEDFRGFTPFQVDCGAAEGHLIAIAPTGSGKTEASWLWALGQVERRQARKILVLLPTMVTANAIHDRLDAFMYEHEHRVGLVHSTSDLLKESTVSGDDEADRADVRGEHLAESHLFRPVTVGTVDQLLIPLLHAGRWAMKTMAAADAAVVIDEIHAYEPHTLGLIALMIEQLAPLGTRFMIMSATMPEALKAGLQKVLSSEAPGAPGVTVVEDADLLDLARNQWRTCDVPLTEWLFSEDEAGRRVPSDDFLRLWKRRNERGEPLKILVVVNTVKRCQDLAKALREFGFDLVCYHSKFIFDDRRAKERRINDAPPRLLVATQVVEVSLDIDYDVLITECAPIDALVQRAGRVNRARRPTLGEVVVHPPEEGSETVYGFPRGVLEDTWNACLEIRTPPTERELIAMVDRVYAGHAMMEGLDFTAIQCATRGLQQRLAGVLDSPKPAEQDALLKTRKDDYVQVSVIPEVFETKALCCHPRERKRFELKVPAWYTRKSTLRYWEDERGKPLNKVLPLCPMLYSPEFGAELLSAPEHPEPGHEIF